jgi:beta-lactamase regulating signal transducer with metallopeptidase domain
VPDLAIGEIIIIIAFFAWCIGAFVFLWFFARRAKKSAAEPEPGRQELDEIIAKVRKTTDSKDPKP